jgi:hypothetical protein
MGVVALDGRVGTGRFGQSVLLTGTNALRARCRLVDGLVAPRALALVAGREDGGEPFGIGTDDAASLFVGFLLGVERVRGNGAGRRHEAGFQDEAATGRREEVGPVLVNFRVGSDVFVEIVSV